MDFHLTTEQIDIQKAAKEFAKGEFDPDAALEYDQTQEFPRSVWKKACDLGFIGVHYPELYGGQGWGVLENALIVEAFCQQDSGMGMALALSDFGSEIIVTHGDKNQKKGILPSLARGESLVTLAFLEEGYPPGPLTTTASLSETGFRINGRKSFVTLGNLANTMIVVCQTEVDNPRAQSVLLCERHREGIKVCSMGEKLGMRMIPVDQVCFTNVSVPRENTIGQEDTGYSQLQDFFNQVRIETSAMGVGIAQGSMDKALEYSKKREQFGRAIINFDVIRNKLADMYVETEMARLITYKAAWCFDTGRPDIRATLLAKIIASKAAYRNTYEAVQIHGGYGYMAEGQIEHFYRDAKALELFLEPCQVQRNMLADRITGRIIPNP
jgi:alkylation response protein AidB-like acyl-CoA dehydrogenase